MLDSPEIKNLLERLYTTDLNKLKREELAGAGFDFNNVFKKVSDIIATYKKIDKNKDKLKIATNEEEQMRNNIQGIVERVVDPVINFTVKDNPHSSQQYQQIIQTLDDLYNSFVPLTRALIIQINFSSLNPEDLKLGVDNFNELKSNTESILKELSEKKEDAEQIIRKAKGVEAASSSGSIFLTQADEYNDLSKKWFIASIVSFLVLFISFVFIFNSWFPFNKFDIENVEDNFSLIHILVFKLLILSSMYFFLHQCVKNYKINKHLYVINKHKHNALSVYPQILTAGEDSETRTSIASQAAKSIFEQASSGYLDYDDDPRPVNPTAVVNKIIERKGS